MLTLLTQLHHTRLMFPQISTFPFPLFNSLTFIQKKKNFSLMGCSSTSLSLSSLHLPSIFICSINYLTFSSTSLFNSPLELPDLFIFPINCTPNFLFKSCARIFYLSPCGPCGPYGYIVFLVSKCVLSPLVYLFIFCYCIHLGALSYMSL